MIKELGEKEKVMVKRMKDGYGYEYFNNIASDSHKAIQTFNHLIIELGEAKCPFCQSQNIRIFGLDSNYKNAFFMECRDHLYHNFSIHALAKTLWEIYKKHYDYMKGGELNEKGKGVDF